MNDFIEPLESRTLMSASYSAAGTYNGTATPQGKGSTAAILAELGIKKGSATLAASLVLNIANNDVVTGSLTLTYAKTKATVGTYVLSGLVVGTDVSITIESTGKAVGTFDGALKSANKKLTGPFSDTINGAAVTGELSLINSASVKTKKTSTTNSSALPAGDVPNETPPTITSGSTGGDQTGTTGGDNSGTGVISDGGGSVLG